MTHLRLAKPRCAAYTGLRTSVLATCKSVDLYWPKQRRAISKQRLPTPLKSEET